MINFLEETLDEFKRWDIAEYNFREKVVGGLIMLRKVDYEMKMMNYRLFMDDYIKRVKKYRKQNRQMMVEISQVLRNLEDRK